MKLVFDIEGNNLLPGLTTFHCADRAQGCRDNTAEWDWNRGNVQLLAEISKAVSIHFRSLRIPQKNTNPAGKGNCEFLDIKP